MSLRDINSRTWCKNYRDLVKWNEQQIHILDEIQASNSNMTVVARAGCGKTSILTGIVGALGSSATGNILAFNAHIADYIKADKRIPNNRIKVSTAHSYGLFMIRKIIDNPVIQKSKYNYLLDKELDNQSIRIEDFVKGNSAYKYSVARDIMYGLSKLLNLCRCWLVNINNIEKILELYDYYGYDFPIDTEHIYTLCKVISNVLIKGRDDAIEGSIIDFGDMIWLPNELELKSNIYKDVVLMDEAQDANLGMIGILSKLIGPSTRAVFMCDDKQEIYGFNGSVPGICNLIHKQFNTKIMPLTYCYRCPESHLELVRKWVPDITCGKEDTKGDIINITAKDMNGKYIPGMVVIGRFNTPLIELGIKLITNGVSIYMPHKDITQGFISLLDSVKDMGIKKASHTLEERMDKELARAKSSKRKTERKVKNIIDRFEGALLIIDTLQNSKPNISSMIRFLEELQNKPEKESVRITTVHSYKGGEADTTVVLESDNMPYYKLCGTDWEMNMEENVAYVAHTRSRRTMYLVNKHK